MITKNTPSFSAVYPFNVKLENHSFGQDVSLLYITNKINETSAFQKVKISVLQEAEGMYTFKGFNFQTPSSIATYTAETTINSPTLAPVNSTHKPDKNAYNLGIVIKQGVLEEGVLLSFTNTLYQALQKSVPNGIACAVQGPFLSDKDNSLTWYCSFGKNMTSVDQVNTSTVTETAEMLKVVQMPNGTLLGIGSDHNIYTCNFQQSTDWQQVTTNSSIQAKSACILPNGQIRYLGLDGFLYSGGTQPGSDFTLIPKSGTLIDIASLPDGSLIGLGGRKCLWHRPNTTDPAWVEIDTTQTFSRIWLNDNGIITGLGTDAKCYQRESLPAKWQEISLKQELMYAQSTGQETFAVNLMDNSIMAVSNTASEFLSFELEGISAASGVGSRSTQMEFLFSSVTTGSNTAAMSFKRSISVDIINHQGHSYAPMHFGVVGEATLLNNGHPQELTLYFQTYQNKPITFSKDTLLTFNFAHSNQNTELVSFGDSSLINTYTFSDQNEGSFSALSTNDGIIKVGLKNETQNPSHALTVATFTFTNIALNGTDGLACIEVVVQNLPGYWDSVYQINISKTKTSGRISEQLELPQSNNNGRSTSNGSRIDFITEGKDKNQNYNISIEAYKGLNLYGTAPNIAATAARGVPTSVIDQQSGLPVRVRETDLLIPDGRLAINGGNNYPKLETGDTNTNEKLNVTGDTYLDGHLGLSQDIGVGGAATIGGNTKIKGTTEMDGGMTVTGGANLNGALTITSAESLNGNSIKPLALDYYDKNLSVLIGKLSDSKGWGTLSIALPKDPYTWPIVVSKNTKHIFTVDGNGNINNQGNIDVGGAATVAGDTSMNRNMIVKGRSTFNSSLTVTNLGNLEHNTTIPMKLDYYKNNLSVLIGKLSDLKGWGALSIALPEDENTWPIVVCKNTKPIFTVDGKGNVQANGYITTQGGINCHGNMGIGTTNPKAPLDVSAHNLTTQTITSGFSYIGEWAFDHCNSCTWDNIAIIAGGRIVAAGQNSYSDERIKTKIAPSDIAKDLQTLLRLKVTDYEYIDKIKNGPRPKKGLIAQEVEKELSNAVNHMTGFVPDIFLPVNSFTVDEQSAEITCVLNQPHSIKAGDTLKLITDHAEVEKEVSQVVDEHTFVLKDWTENTEKLFVYGKQVDDFRTVDYDQVAMMGVSAIQALHQEVQTLKQENKDLKALLQNDMKSLREEMEVLKNNLNEPGQYNTTKK